MQTDAAFNEQHYRISDLAELWGAGRETLRVIFLNEPGVVKIKLGRKKKNVTMLIPASVADRVHRRLSA